MAITNTPKINISLSDNEFTQIRESLKDRQGSWSYRVQSLNTEGNLKGLAKMMEWMDSDDYTRIEAYTRLVAKAVSAVLGLAEELPPEGDVLQYKSRNPKCATITLFTSSRIKTVDLTDVGEGTVDVDRHSVYTELVETGVINDLIHPVHGNYRLSHCQLMDDHWLLKFSTKNLKQQINHRREVASKVPGIAGIPNIAGLEAGLANLIND